MKASVQACTPSHVRLLLLVIYARVPRAGVGAPRPEFNRRGGVSRMTSPHVGTGAPPEAAAPERLCLTAHEARRETPGREPCSRSGKPDKGHRNGRSSLGRRLTRRPAGNGAGPLLSVLFRTGRRTWPGSSVVLTPEGVTWPSRLSPCARGSK